MQPGEHRPIAAQSQQWPRSFLVTWNYAKCKAQARAKYHQRESLGVQFPGGLIALEAQMGYQTLSEMEDELHELGEYSIVWQDEA